MAALSYKANLLPEVLKSTKKSLVHMSSLPVSLTEHHGEVDVLEIQDTDGQVGGQNTGQ